MGIKDFTKLFKATYKTSLKTLGGKNTGIHTIAVDAMTLIYSSSLGIGEVNKLSHNGKPTAFMQVLWYVIINMIKAKLTPIFVFDNPMANKLKHAELSERKSKREKARDKMNELNEEIKNMEDIKVDTDEDEGTKQKISEKKAKVKKLEKQTFVVEQWMINEVKFMLDCFGLPWFDAPPGIEAECYAAAMTHEFADAVLSTDADTLLFGAKKLIKRNPFKTNEYAVYDLAELLADNDITRQELVKIGVVLGCDFFKDKQSTFPRIGVKTVIKKVKSGSLDEPFENNTKVKLAYEHFMKKCVFDFDLKLFQKKGLGLKKLVEHMTGNWGFNKTRLLNSLKSI